MLALVWILYLSLPFISKEHVALGFDSSIWVGLGIVTFIAFSHLLGGKSKKSIAMIKKSSDIDYLFSYTIDHGVYAKKIRAAYGGHLSNKKFKELFALFSATNNAGIEARNFEKMYKEKLSKTQEQEQYASESRQMTTYEIQCYIDNAIENAKEAEERAKQNLASVMKRDPQREIENAQRDQLQYMQDQSAAISSHREFIRRLNYGGDSSSLSYLYENNPIKEYHVYKHATECYAEACERESKWAHGAYLKEAQQQVEKARLAAINAEAKAKQEIENKKSQIAYMTTRLSNLKSELSQVSISHSEKQKVFETSKAELAKFMQSLIRRDRVSLFLQVCLFATFLYIFWGTDMLVSQDRSIFLGWFSTATEWWLPFTNFSFFIRNFSSFLNLFMDIVSLALGEAQLGFRLLAGFSIAVGISGLWRVYSRGTLWIILGMIMIQNSYILSNFISMSSFIIEYESVVFMSIMLTGVIFALPGIIINRIIILECVNI